MNIRLTLKTLVTSIGEELAQTNERNRNLYYQALTAKRNEEARVAVGEVEKSVLPKPEPPMQVVITNPDALVSFLTDKLGALTRAAEKWDEHEEGIESMAGVKAYRFDPENPSAGPYGVMPRSVMSGNVASPGIPAAEPSDSQVGVEPLSPAVHGELARQDAEKHKQAAQRLADRTGTAVAEPVSGAVVQPKVPAPKEEPVTRRGGK